VNAVPPTGEDATVRAAAFAYIDEIARRRGDVVERSDLEACTFKEHRLPLLEQQKGIRKPAGFDAALAILTAHTSDPAKAPYDDGIGDDGCLGYEWCGADGEHPEHRGLPTAMRPGLPLLYFYGVGPGRYVASRVWLVGEEPERH